MVKVNSTMPKKGTTSRAEHAGKQRGGDNDIEPFLDDFTIHAGHFQHDESQNRGHHQFPNAFDPQMDDIPPEHLVFRQIAGVIQREQEEDGDAPQAEQQHIGDRGLASLQHRHRDVEQEDQRGDDNAELYPKRLLQIGARFTGVDVEQIADHRRQRAKEEDAELDIGEFRRIDFALRFFRHQIIGRAKKAEQQPDDQRIGVHHADDVERQQLRKDVRHDVDKTADQAKADLDGEDQHGAIPIDFGDALSFISH